MILVVPFCIKDCRSALKNIEWSYELEGQLPNTVLLSYDTDVPDEQVEQITQAARKAFAKVIQFRYGEWRGKPNWPNPQNYAFQCLCWEIINKHKEEFLFWEPDAIPIRKGWVADIEHSYAACGKPFLGHIVHGVIHPTSMHLNGVAVYPPDLHVYSTHIMLPPDGVAWDVAGAFGGVVPNARHTSLIMNVWEIDEDGNSVTSGGVVPTFPDQATVDKVVDFSASLFHRCKDMSLIDRLRERKAAKESKPKAQAESKKTAAVKKRKRRKTVSK